MCFSDLGGVLKSTNGGDRWSPSSTGLGGTTISALAIDPATPSTLYAGTYRGVFKSTNGGGSWSAINTSLTNPDVRTLAIDPATPSTLYAGTAGGGVFGLVQSSSCAATAVLEGTPDRESRLSVLYDFRDKVLAATPTGQRYINLFYTHSVEAVWLMLRYPALRSSSRVLLDQFLPTLQAIVAGRPASLTRTDLTAIDTLFAAFAARASGGFRADLQEVQKDLRRPTVLRQLRIPVQDHP